MSSEASDAPSPRQTSDERNDDEGSLPGELVYDSPTDQLPGLSG